jgi:hypothetical protein
LILIMGGLLLLPISLMMSRSGTRPATTRARFAEAGPAGLGAHAAATPAPAPAASGAAYPEPHLATITVWEGSALERAIRQAVGGTRLVSAAPGQYVVRLSHCQSCAHRLVGCELERAAIERAMGAFLRHARVRERSCGQRDRMPCAFELTGD